MPATEQTAAEGPTTGPGDIGMLYVLAWLPYLAVYTFVLASMSGLPVLDAFVGAAANVVPPAVLGIVVLRAGQPAPSRSRLGAHLVRGTAFTMLSVAGTWLLFLPMWRWRLGAWIPASTDWRPVPWQLFISALIYVVLASITESLRLRERLRREETRAARARELQVRAELGALRSQLDPHFLFNTLQTLLELFRSEPDAAEEALERFTDLLRYQRSTRQSERRLVELGAEWRFTASYLHLEQLRLGERLRFSMQATPEALACHLPPFTLQPLVENAVRHGVAPRRRGGRIEVRAAVDDGTLKLSIEDDGDGAEPSTLERARGLGLRLVRDRLGALYGEGADLDLRTAPGRGFTVRIELPATTDSVDGGGPVA